MSETDLRRAERQAANGGPEEAVRVARLTCRKEGHDEVRSFVIDARPDVFRRATVSLCWRCHELLSFEDVTPLSRRAAIVGSVAGRVFQATEEFQATNGNHFQHFVLGHRGILRTTMRVYVDEKMGEGWVAWTQLDSLILTGPEGRHFSLRAGSDYDTAHGGPSARVEFGDGVFGSIPMGFAGIRVVYEYLATPED